MEKGEGSGHTPSRIPTPWLPSCCFYQPTQFSSGKKLMTRYIIGSTLVYTAGTEASVLGWSGHDGHLSCCICYAHPGVWSGEWCSKQQLQELTAESGRLLCAGIHLSLHGLCICDCRVSTVFCCAGYITVMLSCLLLYVYRSTPWIILSEMFPLRVKGKWHLNFPPAQPPEPPSIFSESSVPGPPRQKS